LFGFYKRHIENMKKRIFLVLLVMMMVLPSIVWASEETVTSEGKGYSNIAFSNGYVGFCIDSNKNGTTEKVEFGVIDTKEATDNNSGTDVSNKLKIMFTQFFEELFEQSGEQYVLKRDFDNAQNDAVNKIQAVIWNYTDNGYIWGTQKILKENIEAYSGPDIPDDGYQKTLANGDIITFHFSVMKPFPFQEEKDQVIQSFFTYKLDVQKAGSHEHEYSVDWKSDDDQHWHECECGEKSEVEDHEFSEEWTTDDNRHWHECECGTKAEVADHTPIVVGRVEAEEFKEGYTGDTICEICEKVLEKGKVTPATHEHDYSEEWESDDNQHWHECKCEDKSEVADHTPIVVGRVEAEEFKEGYTGDTICEICEKVLEKGEVIPATHEHDYSEEWESDDNQHWHECKCEDKSEVADHTPIVVGRVEAEEFKEGYTGDTICEICEKVLEKGKVTPATHEHDYSEEWESDDNQHWHECKCENKSEVADHTPIIVGKVEAEEFKEGYTGDTICEICEKVLEKGKVTPATHEHDYSEEWESDDNQHWHECECGETTEKAEHVYDESKSDQTKHWDECDCGKKANEEEHKFDKEKHDKTNHWHECECGEKSNVEKHEFSEEWTTDDKQHWHECECGETTEKAEHVYDESKSDDKKHWDECDCGKKANEEEHKFDKEKHDETNHWTECECGEKSEVEKHEFSEEWTTDDKQHWHECECGETTEKAEHVYDESKSDDKKHWDECDCGKKANEEEHKFDKEKHDKTNHWTECECGEKSNVEEHKFNEEWTTDDNQHWHECDCGETTEKAEHVYDESKSDDKKHWDECDCGKKANEEEHKFDKEKHDKTNHWTECECGEKSNVEKHEFSEKWTTDDKQHWHECKCEDKSEVADHTPIIVGRVEAEEFKEGYTGDKVCEICEKVLEKGKVTPATHEHDYSEE